MLCLLHLVSDPAKGRDGDRRQQTPVCEAWRKWVSAGLRMSHVALPAPPLLPSPQNSSPSGQAKTDPSREEAGHVAQSQALKHQPAGDLHSLAEGTAQAARLSTQSVQPALPQPCPGP